MKTLILICTLSALAACATRPNKAAAGFTAKSKPVSKPVTAAEKMPSEALSDGILKYASYPSALPAPPAFAALPDAV